MYGRFPKNLKTVKYILAKVLQNQNFLLNILYSCCMKFYFYYTFHVYVICLLYIYYIFIYIYIYILYTICFSILFFISIFTVFNIKLGI